MINLVGAETTGADENPHLLHEPGLRVLLSIVEPTFGPIRHTQRETHKSWWLCADHGWAEITTVTYGGPRNIWTTIEGVAAQWQRSARPGRGRYDLTATAEGTHHYWLDQPDRLLRTGIAATSRSAASLSPLAASRDTCRSECVLKTRGRSDS